MALYQKSFTDKTVDRIASLPHPTVQKFTVITVAIVGASRRFLAQITRHQNEVKFMSASLQYSNYSEKAAFTIPYEILFSEQRYIDLYLKSCLSDLRCYQELCSVGFHHDSAGYALPHALRNILIICATPYEWKHMISQRICRRNTDETRIVMLDILFNLKYYKQYSLSNIILHLSIHFVHIHLALYNKCIFLVFDFLLYH